VRDEVERGEERGGEGGREFVKSLPRSLHPVISRQLARPDSYYSLCCIFARRATRASPKFLRFHNASVLT